MKNSLEYEIASRRIFPDLCLNNYLWVKGRSHLVVFLRVLKVVIWLPQKNDTDYARSPFIYGSHK
jgi:hypothetical protein